MFKRIIKLIIPDSLLRRVNEKLRRHYVSDIKNVEYKVNIQNAGRFAGKTCLVTGATGAIGSAICLRMAAEGAIVGVCGRSSSKISMLIEKIKSIYPEARLEPINLDVTDTNKIESAIRAFSTKMHNLDLLINNAGGGNREQAQPLRNQSVELIDSVLNVNLRGSILCAKAASSIMVKQGSGKIINISSVMGICGKENWSEYSASKAGIIGLTKSLALELGEYKITVNSVCPGMVFQKPFDRCYSERYSHTNALKRFGYTDEVANLVAFLCSDEANYITGQNIVIDGGRSIGLK